MPRPKAIGKVCQLPEIDLFGPVGKHTKQTDIIYLSIEEYEAVRLIDYIGLTQEKCAQEMDIARTTLQRIYYNAKYKISDVMINGKSMKIAGGNYRLCKEEIDPEKCKYCPYFDRNSK